MSTVTIPRRKQTEWEADNPVLRKGELVSESTSNRLKIGDGRTRWRNLPWVAGNLAHEVRQQLIDILSDSGGESGDGVTPEQLAAAVELLQDKATAATDSELAAAIATIDSALAAKQNANTAATDAELADAVSLLQDKATAATDTELSDAITTINNSLSAKQDASTAATDSELAAAVSTINSALSMKQDASLAATDAEVAAAVATLNSAVSAKQDASTAATDVELAAHAADSSLHSSGQRTGYAVNNTGTIQTITTSSVAIPSTSVPLAQISRPQVLRGRVAIKCTGAMVAGNISYVVLNIVDDLGNILEGGLMEFNNSTTNTWITMFVEADIEADAAARTYHLEILRGGSTSGTLIAINNNVAGFRSALRAQAC